MHLAYLHYLDPGDTAVNHVRQFSDAARGLGHRVDVIPGHPAAEGGVNGSPSQGARTKSALKNRLSRYLHDPKVLLTNPRNSWREFRALRDLGPDVLLVRHDYMSASFVPVARRLGLPLVIEINGMVDESRRYGRYLQLPFIPEWLESWTLHHADRLTVVSQTLRDHVAECLALSPDKIVVVPNGADLAAFRPDTPRDPELPASFGDSVSPRGDSLVIGWVGSFQKWQRADLLARMATAVAAARDTTRFLYVGDGPEADTVRRRTAPLGERLLMTGRVPHARVPGLVAALDVAVMPESLFYASPLKVIEWMAAGKAVVAPAHGPLKEIIEDGREGLLFPPGDGDALIEAVLRLVDDAELRRELGQNAAERSHSSLSWADNARRVLAACDEARAGKGS